MTPARTPGGRGGTVLASCKGGRDVRLAGIRAGRELRARLAAMGLVPGIRLRVMRQEGGGPLVVALRGMRLAIGRVMAEKMDVEPWSGS
ncbi:MAG: ferrous iron transport protein A [Lentisphaerae bacterium]|nr:ferrous iron transport protein A [Lentisphaerota bacterium]